jgi:PAS domain S-box-containing protein
MARSGDSRRPADQSDLSPAGPLLGSERLRATFEALPDPVCVLDGRGRWLLANTAHLKLFGLEGTAYAGRTAQELETAMSADPRSLRAWMGTEDEAAEGLMTREEVRLGGEGQAARVFDVIRAPAPNGEGDSGGRIVVGRDITERKRAEDMLFGHGDRMELLSRIYHAMVTAQSPEEIFRLALRGLGALLRTMRCSVLAIDPARGEGRILAVEGLSAGRLEEGEVLPLEKLGIPGIRELRSPSTIQDTVLLRSPTSVQQSLIEKGVRSIVSVPLIAQDELIGLLNVAAREPDAFDAERLELIREVANALSVAVQQQRLRREILRYSAELEQRVAQRTAELRRAHQELANFTDTATHDLASAVRSIHGFTQLLIASLGDAADPETRCHAERILNSAREMSSLLTNLLAYRHLFEARVPLQPVCLEAIVCMALEELDEAIADAEARVEVIRPLPNVIGHRATLRLVLRHLLENALKFIPPAGRPELFIHAEHREGFVRLWIEDRGIGIEPTYRECIFNIFERLHGGGIYPGKGIGLAIVKRGMERMEGRTGVESNPGGGSRFWIELPALETQ